MAESTHTKAALVPELRFSEFDKLWKYSKIEDYFDFKNGLNKEKEFFGKGTPIINFMDVYKLTSISKDNIEGLVELNNSELTRYSALKGDVFFTRTSETIKDIGMSATLVDEVKDCVFSGFVLRARARNSFFHPLFTSYLFNTNSVRKEIITKSSMTTRALTSGTLLNKVYFKFPENKNEQQKIASFLTAVDQRIALLQSKKEQLDLYKKGVMQQLFSQELRFKDANGQDFPEWEEKRLGEVATFFSGGTPKSSNKKYYSGTIPFIGSGNISDSQVDQFITEEAMGSSSAKIINKGDLLYALYGATSGEVAVSKIEGAINQAILCIRTTEEKYYLYYLLSYNKGRITKKFLQGGQGNLSAQIIKKLKYNFPCKQEQQKIASFLGDLDAGIEKVGEQIAQTQAWKKGLFQRMFV